MLSSEWNDFFGIEDANTMDSYMDEEYTEGADAENDAVKALLACLNMRGCIDILFMEKLSGLSAAEIIKVLRGAIFQIPEKYDVHHLAEEDWVLRQKYLSGNIREKLDTARKFNRKYKGYFDENVKALQAVMPEQVGIEDIGISIGSPWIPEKYYMQFVKELLELHTPPAIRRSSLLGQWKVEMTLEAKDAVHNLYTYGTLRFPALKIIEHTLNGATVKVYDEVPRPDRKSGKAQVLNKTETLAAQEKQELLQKKFQEWIIKDRTRVKNLEKIFYDTFACNVSGRYNGSFLDLPDLNKACFTPYPHQKDAVARIIFEKDLLLYHDVGTGKTYIMIMGIHERKRLGLSDKNLVVVPNNVLEAFESGHHKLYPEDRILVVHPEDAVPSRKQKMLEKIRDEDFTAIYMPYSVFDGIHMSRQYKLDQQSELIRRYRAKAATTVDHWEKRTIEALVIRHSAKLQEMLTELPYDKYIPFDELNITSLVVDEAHNYKNITIRTKADGIVGMHSKGSTKCDSMHEKTDYVRNHDGGVIFASGTPLTNSIADLYVLQTYLQPEQLEMLGISYFDQWINNFASRHTGFEIDVDSLNFRIRTRFSSFHNIPELLSLFADVCDFYSSQEGEDTFFISECDGYTDTIVQRTKLQAEYIDDLVLRTEMIRQKLVKPSEDNLLKVTHDGRAAALDIQLVDPAAVKDIRTTKCYACARNVYRLYKSYPDTAQLVFCDLGTPKKGFNVYDQMKMILTGMGIPAQQIAYVHDADNDHKRRKLFEATNEAEVRVLIGSTSRLGTGTNVQKHLIAIHHLDIPWRPSDMVQREGRLIRQGNRNEKVFKFRYITAGTFDAYSWQLLENKQRFISQLTAGSAVTRDMRDIDETVLTYAEIKALSVGDPLLRTRIETGNELERLKLQERQRDKELDRYEMIISKNPVCIRSLEAKKKRIDKDYAYFEAKREKLSREERRAFGEELIYAVNKNVLADAEHKFDVIHGFKIILPENMKPERPYTIIEGISGERYRVDMKDAVPGGCVQRIEAVLLHLTDRARAVQSEADHAEKEMRQAIEQISTGNIYSGQVREMAERLLDIDAELERRANENV